MTGRWLATGFIAFLAAGAVPRLYLATLGHNYDLASFVIVVRSMLEGESVYAATGRYNYGPAWSSILFGLLQVHGLFFSRFDPQSFHLIIAGFLSCVDAALATLLATRFGYGAGVVFYLSPVSMLITGFHSQFDNLAVLIALFSWLLIEPPERRAKPTSWVTSAALLGLSLVAKHVFLVFPLWLVLWSGLGSLRRRFAYVSIVYGVFFASFLPWASDPASRLGIVRNVFLYGSDLGGLLPLAVRIASGESAMPSAHFFQTVWITALAVLGWFAMRRRPADAPYLYLAGLIGLAQAMADQYLAIPLTACARFRRHWSGWAYTAMALGALLLSPQNFNREMALDLARTLPPVFGLVPAYYLLAYSVRVPLLALVFRAIRDPERSS